MNNVTFQEVALIAVLLAAIIVSHAFVPTAAAAIVSMVTTLTGYFFAARIQQKKALEAAEQAPDTQASPVLKLVPKDGQNKDGE